MSKEMLELAEKLVNAPDAEYFGLTAYHARELIEAALRASAVAEPVAWFYETWNGGEFWSKHLTDEKPAGEKWQRNIIALYAHPAPAAPVPASDDYILPCDVKLPPATTITKGCTLSTLMAAFKVRERGWPEVTPERIAAINELLKPEFEAGVWQTVESEQEAAPMREEIAQAICGTTGNGFLVDCSPTKREAYLLQADAILALKSAPAK